MGTVAATAPEAHEPRVVGSVALVAGTIGWAIIGFLFRFLTIEFTNDHFVHLSRAWQILQGDVPIRDFFDPGLILQYYASAAALRWSGHNLFGEALLTTGFIGAGAGLTYLAAARLSRSAWWASTAACIAIMSTPRLYNYPKVFFYVLAIVGAWHYAHRPDLRRIAALAVITAVAFLFRHDHGVYIGLAVLALLAIRHSDEPGRGVRSLLQYGGITVLLLSPFLVFVQQTAGLVRYVGGIAPQVRRVSSPQLNWLPIKIDRSAPLLAVTPAADRRVNIRWRDDLDENARHQLESRHRLLRPDHVEESTWSYVLASEDREDIAALVDDPAVADTHGIDRAARRLDIQEPLYVRIQRWIPLFRMQVAPGVLTRDNALVWFYYVTFLLPFAGLALLGYLLWRGAIDRREAAVAGMAAVLSLIVVQTLVRGSPDSRLADVANPVCVIGAWVAVRLSRPAAADSRVWRVARTGSVLLVTLLTIWSVAADARVVANLDVSRILTGPAGAWWRMGVVSERLRVRPIDAFSRTDAGIPGLARYLFECTAPDDRVLVTWFDPQIFFYAERPFAGGQVYLTANWHASAGDQQLTIERLQHQRVPVVLERTDGEYPVRFPQVYQYVQTHYRNAPMTSEGMALYRVLVDSGLTPTGTYEPLGLPCYR